MNLGVGAYRDDNNKVRQKSNPHRHSKHTHTRGGSTQQPQTRTVLTGIKELMLMLNQLLRSND
jgi:hypothetical protein